MNQNPGEGGAQVMQRASVWLWLAGLALAVGLGLWTVNRQVEALVRATDVDAFASWVEA